MRFNVCHTFALEAEDQDDFDAKLSRYKRLVSTASSKLDIGYSSGWMQGQLDPSDRHMVKEEPEHAERLFDG